MRWSTTRHGSAGRSPAGPSVLGAGRGCVYASGSSRPRAGADRPEVVVNSFGVGQCVVGEVDAVGELEGLARLVGDPVGAGGSALGVSGFRW